MQKKTKKKHLAHLLSLCLSQVIGDWKSLYVVFRLRAEPHEHNEVSVLKPHGLFQEVTSSVYNVLTQMHLRGSWLQKLVILDVCILPSVASSDSTLQIINQNFFPAAPSRYPST